MWPTLKLLCQKLATPGTYDGICPENLEKVIAISGYLNEEAREELDDFMGKARLMFAPRSEIVQAAAEQHGTPVIEVLTFVSEHGVDEFGARV